MDHPKIIVSFKVEEPIRIQGVKVDDESLLIQKEFHKRLPELLTLFKKKVPSILLGAQCFSNKKF